MCNTGIPRYQDGIRLMNEEHKYTTQGYMTAETKSWCVSPSGVNIIVNNNTTIWQRLVSLIRRCKRWLNFPIVLSVDSMAQHVL